MGKNTVNKLELSSVKLSKLSGRKESDNVWKNSDDFDEVWLIEFDLDGYFINDAPSLI